MHSAMAGASLCEKKTEETLCSWTVTSSHGQGESMPGSHRYDSDIDGYCIYFRNSDVCMLYALILPMDPIQYDLIICIDIWIYMANTSNLAASFWLVPLAASNLSFFRRHFDSQLGVLTSAMADATVDASAAEVKAAEPV